MGKENAEKLKINEGINENKLLEIGGLFLEHIRTDLF